MANSVKVIKKKDREAFDAGKEIKAKDTASKKAVSVSKPQQPAEKKKNIIAKADVAVAKIQTEDKKKPEAMKEKPEYKVIVTVREGNALRASRPDANVQKDDESEKEITRIVVPGEVLEDNINGLAGTGTYRVDTKVYSKYVGLLKKREHAITVIPLAGVYMPKKWDFVIGEVTYVSFSNWKVDVGSPYSAVLPLSAVPEYIDKGEDLTKYYKRGDLIFAKIDSVTPDMAVQLSLRDHKTRKLYGGHVIEITPAKVPRLIGKDGTMISMIKDKCGSLIFVGQNGIVWLKGGNESLATRAIKMVGDYSHKEGLTDMVSKFLDEEIKKGGNAGSVSASPATGKEQDEILL